MYSDIHRIIDNPQRRHQEKASLLANASETLARTSERKLSLTYIIVASLPRDPINKISDFLFIILNNVQ